MWYELLDKDKSNLNPLHKRVLVDVQFSPVLVTDFVSLIISILSIIIYQRTIGMEG